MKEFFSSTSVQIDTQVLLLQTEKRRLLSLQISAICSTIKESFPLLKFEWKIRQDNGVNFLIHDINVYLSTEFEQFLEIIANTLTDEEYMCIDFLPSEKEFSEIHAYNTTTLIANNPIHEISSQGQTVTDKNYMEYDNQPVLQTGDFSNEALAA